MAHDVPKRLWLHTNVDSYLNEATVLGGSGEIPAFVGATVSLRFTPTEMRLRLDEMPDEPVWSIPFIEVHGIEFSGPGKPTTGGGVVGGGVGVDGMAFGMAAAGLVNALSTKTSFTTFVHIDTSHGEIFLLSTMEDPQTMRIGLTAACWRLSDRQRRNAS